jgi:hypothetical protein
MIDLTQLPPEQQLDFWLGSWTVTWGDDQHGSNEITRILDGRVIEENFDGAPTIDFRGLSHSVYSAHIGLWRQTWVDNGGAYWHFTGSVAPDHFIFAADDIADGRPIKLRMVFYNIAEDQLDWRWERSDDNGQNWQLRWQLHYTRK